MDAVSMKEWKKRDKWFMYNQV